MGKSKAKSLRFNGLTPGEWALFYKLAEFFPEAKTNKDIFLAMLRKLESLYT